MNTSFLTHGGGRAPHPANAGGAASAPEQFGQVAQVERREATYTALLPGLPRSGMSVERLEPTM